ncbi:hypothetical protein WN51_13937 [Melipona quadrifasciata]|uniref:Uncharacterized protein n=1 Tax=Melipona quadrifasciata TaxID=166423 RepID=A0A0M9A1G7_9HYME|nr:hypothetical protein WN51_13937 [Melipona quadrifasciata]
MSLKLDPVSATTPVAIVDFCSRARTMHKDSYFRQVILSEDDRPVCRNSCLAQNRLMVRVARKERDATMAERPGGRRRSRQDSIETGGSLRGTPPTSKERRTKRSNKPSKERWLLTRKTWRYMADAGRRLIPDGTHNRPEDIPKIEQYFQEVCQKEPRFLLWRKASYPGTLAFRSQRRRRQIKGGSCRTKASSADEADDVRHQPQGFVLQTTTAGKFDLAKAKREWLMASEGGSIPSSPVEHRKFMQEDSETKALADMLQKYLNMQSDVAGTTKLVERSGALGLADGKEPFDYQNLISKLQHHLDLMLAQAKLEELSVQRALTTEKDAEKVSKSMQPYQGDYVHKSLMDTIGRYYSKSGTREHVISSILTDRKLLEKLYFDLRIPSKESEDWLSVKRDPISLPPLIAVQEPSTDRSPTDNGVQTDPVPREVLDAILLEREKEELSAKEVHKPTRRRSSVDNDDVSPSVSDTIKRYLRMARKKSMDADKVDRFKRVNYDRNLRNIKAKGETTSLGEDDGNNKGCQTEDNWAVNYREMSSMENPSENLSDAETTTSPPSGTAMQKSKSSSSVVHHGSRLVAKKIWRSRSKSTSRASNQPSVWTPQGKCTWAGTSGRRVTLQNTSLRSLSEIERKVLCKVAVAKLQALNLGVHIRPPSESLGSSSVVTKPKRRAPLLKRKALTTGFFDNKGKEDKEKELGAALVLNGLILFKIWTSKFKIGYKLTFGAYSSSKVPKFPSHNVETMWRQYRCSLPQSFACNEGYNVIADNHNRSERKFRRLRDETEMKSYSNRESPYQDYFHKQGNENNFHGTVNRKKLLLFPVASVANVKTQFPMNCTNSCSARVNKPCLYEWDQQLTTLQYMLTVVTDSPGGLVFGIPLSQCLENDRIARIAAGEVSDVGCLSRSSRHGSRTSFTSLIEPTVAAKTDEMVGPVVSYKSKLHARDSGGFLSMANANSYNQEFYSVLPMTAQFEEDGGGEHAHASRMEIRVTCFRLTWTNLHAFSTHGEIIRKVSIKVSLISDEYAYR